MNDCPNALMRDRLPDLLHERLDAAVRAEVMAHVSACADCTAELALLRDIRGVLSATPRVDVQRIVRQLPSPALVQAARIPSRSRWVNWRVAASIAVLAIGGASVGTYMKMGSSPLTESTIDSSARPRTVVPRETATASTANIAAPVKELSTGEALNDMSDSQLKALLKDIQSIQPLPSSEPDSTLGSGYIGDTESN